jgi:tetratricopeptide (TPR) repeat protein
VPLRAEVEAGGDRTRQAILLYEIGHIVERDASNDAQAVREYLGAYNQDPTFRPPLFALLRLFERRRSFKNLARLYEAELKSATSGQERASAIIDRAALLSDHLGQPEQEVSLLEQACDEDGESTAAPLMLEWRARLTGDLESIRAALQLRAGRTKDTILKGLLLVELAAAREESGDLDGALETLRAAARLPVDRARFLSALEQTARRHQRFPELVAALEGRAALRAADGEAADGPKLAAGAWLEAARLRLVQLGDAEGARTTLEKALAVAPDDVALLREHMLACEAAGDAAAAAEGAARVLDRGVENRHAAPFYFRLAEAAQMQGDGAQAVARLRRAAEVAPESVAIRATLEDVALGGGDLGPVLTDLDEQGDSLLARGESAAAAVCFLRAATWARDVGRSQAHAEALYDRALAAGADRILVLRERLIATAELGDLAGGTGIQAIVDGALALARESGVEPVEASTCLRTAYHAALSTPYEDATRVPRIRSVLEVAIEHPHARSEWAADASRLFAAGRVTGGEGAPSGAEDVSLLVRAHQVLATDAESPDLAAAHLCAAARASVRGGQEDQAIELLKAAVTKVPSQRYAITLLEEIYRRRGDADAVVRILREAASEDASGRAMVTQLLSAGAAAESAGDRALAISTYREAHERDRDAEGPLNALRRVAERAGDGALRIEAIGLLASREARLMEGDGPAPSPVASLDLGEHALLKGASAEGVPALRRALSVETTRVSAALALALGSDARARLAGVRGLVEPTGAAALVLRDQLTLASTLRAEVGESAEADADVLASSEDAMDAADALLAYDAGDRVALFDRLQATTVGTTARADALFALADATDDAALAAELTLAGMRASAAVALAGGEAEDATLRAAEIADRAPESFDAALAYAEAFGDVDDAGERAEALSRFLPLLGKVGLSHAEQTSLRLEHARALVDAVRGDEVIETLSELAEDPDDLAAFETLRVAARDAGAHRMVVLACDRLAEVVTGELRAQLLEEAASVLMDYLEVDAEAEPRLRAALAEDPRRPIAYARLHDVLADRGDDAGLLTLLVARIDVTDDPDALGPLFYEEARLRRALGERDDALGALDNLFMLEPEHVGGLALLVEIHVQLESWQEAVDALRRLAEAADVPAAQRRIARLGAADFLEKRLQKPDEAIAELQAIEALGLGDRNLYERMAAISERAGNDGASVAALRKGAEAAADRGERASLHRRRAQLHERRGEQQEAAAAYRDALAAAPLDVAAADALGRLVALDERKSVGAKLEEAARAALSADPSEPSLLRALRSAAQLKGEPELERIVLVALVAARMAEGGEERGGVPVVLPLRDGATLSDATLGAVRLDLLLDGADSKAVLELVDLATEALLELDRLEPSSFGVGRAELIRGGAASSAGDLVSLATVLGAAPAELYVGGRDPAGSFGLAYRGKPLWVFGASAHETPVRSRFVTAQLALGVRLGVSPIAQRIVREGPDAAIDALLATVAAAGAPLEAGRGRAGVDAMTARLAKVVGRRARRAAPEVVAKLGDGRAVAAYVRGLRATLLRVGALTSGDLGLALDAVGGSGVARTERSTRENAEARELLRFWISPAAASLRTELSGR